jgi:uncharacterized protein (DUF2267 family)
MSQHTGVTHLSHAAQQAQEWIRDLVARPPFETEEQAYSYLRAVLHALRDRLTMEEAVHLASQLPMMVRGFYYDGWKPSKTPVDVRTQREFFDLVRTNLGGALPAAQIDTMAATHTVLEFLADHVDPGELNHIRGQLPKELKELITTGVAG